MLLERIDELTIRSHDFRGNPAALIGSFVRRIDRLKDELISAEDYAAWAERLAGSADTVEDDATRARAARERELQLTNLPCALNGRQRANRLLAAAYVGAAARAFGLHLSKLPRDVGRGEA